MDDKKRSITLMLNEDDTYKFDKFMEAYQTNTGGVPVAGTSVVRHALHKFMDEWNESNLSITNN